MFSINIVGAGSLGSFTTFLLSKMAGAFHWRITVFDHDIVEPRNALNQLYRLDDVGYPKVAVLQKILNELETSSVEAEFKKIDAAHEFDGIVVTLVDSMAARRAVFEACKYRANIPLYIDARTGEGVALVYVLDPRNPDLVERYERTLHADEEGVPAPCANQETIPTLWVVAAAISNALAFFSNSRIPRSELWEIAVNMEHLPTIETNVYTD